MKIYDCEQGSPEWFKCRMGIPTASKFAEVMREKGRGAGGKSKTRWEYMRLLAGEIITGRQMETYRGPQMQRGKDNEGEARALYAMLKDIDVQQVGFIREGDKGCSPDSLVGDPGMLEIKDRAPHIQIDVLTEKKIPNEVKMQLDGQLLVAQREWVDYVSHCPGMPLFVKRWFRDEDRLAKLKLGIDRFNYELNELVESIRRTGHVL